MSNILPITAISPPAQTSYINTQFAAVTQPELSAQTGVVAKPMAVQRTSATIPSENSTETILQETATQTNPIIATQTARDVQTVLAAQTIMAMPVPGAAPQPFRQTSVRVEAIDAVLAVTATGNMFESAENTRSDESYTSAGEEKAFIKGENIRKHDKDQYIDVSL